MKKLTMWPVLIGLTALSGCSLYWSPLAPWLDPLDRAELKRLCEKDAGYEINKVVEVEGYYDDFTDCNICGDIIISSGYSFIEFNNREPDSFDPMAKKGLWRVFLAENGDPHCNIKLQSQYEGYKALPYPDFAKSNYCIATKKIEEIGAEYGYFYSSSKRFLDEDKKDYITEYQSSIEHLETGDTIAEYQSYRLYISADGQGSTFSCSDIDSKYGPIGLRQEVLKTTKSWKYSK